MSDEVIEDSPEAQETRAIDDVLVKFRHMLPWVTHDGSNPAVYDAKRSAERMKTTLTLVDAIAVRWVEMREVMPPLPLTLIALQRGLQRHDLGLYAAEVAWLVHTLQTRLGASNGHWQWDEHAGALH